MKRRQSKYGRSMSLFMTTAVLCVVSPALTVSASDLSDAPTTRIYGGEAAKKCEWPSTIGFGGCTGTLVHPQVVLYAAHCGKQRKVMFGETNRGAAKTVPIKFCKINPKYRGISKGTDFAFCVLSEPVEGVTIAPIAYGCELEQIKPGAKVWNVGFGETERKVSGVKYEVEVSVNKLILNNREVLTGGDGKATCYGDSGGPTFIKLSDGSWRVMGITSYGTNSKCGYPSGLTMANIAVPWIHKELKAAGMDDIDLTPCYEDDGTWAPGEGCTKFPLELGTGFGSWDNMCSEGAKLSGPSTICAPEGEKIPTVQIEGPSPENPIEVGQTVEINAAAKDESGQAPKVALMVNGKSHSELSKEPYKWSIEAKEAGDLVLQLVAINAAGNKGESEKLELKVVEAEKPKSKKSDEPSEPNGGEKDSEASDEVVSPTPSEEASDASGDSESEEPDPEDSDAEGDSGKGGERGGCRMNTSHRESGIVGSMLLLLLGSVRRRRASGRAIRG